MRRTKPLLATAAAVSLAGLVTTLPASPARACGGFFCAQTPIDQSGEYILFSIDDKGVRAYVQIQYQGKAEDFAWVVPVMSAPRKIGVGVQQVFTSLMNATLPQFQLDWRFNDGASCSARFAAAGPTSPGAGSSANDAGGVNVISAGEVGPYNYVVVSAKESAKLKTWLDENGFVQPPSATEPLAHYVKQGFVFVAIKLKRDAESGDIQPLVMDMDHQETCVPLVLTRIAAVPDMPIYALVLGKHQAAPRNWFKVELNPARIDWFTNGSNYRSLVTEAVNEAAGRGFVTEFSGDTTRFKSTLWAPGRFDVARLATINDPVAFATAMLNMGLPRDPIVQSLLRKYIPMPASVRAAGVSEATFYNSLGAYREALAGQPFDPVAFTKELEDRIVTPLREAQEMLDGQPYLTRLFTTVSPEEMTRDPLFDFNPDLKPVSNVHVAKGAGTCSTSTAQLSDVTLTFEDGSRQTYPGSFFAGLGPNLDFARTLPAARRFQVVGPSGPPVEVARARVKAVDQQLDVMDPKLVRELVRAEPEVPPPSPPPPPPPPTPPPTPTPTPPTTSPTTPTPSPADPGAPAAGKASGCAFAGPGGDGAGALGLLAALLLPLLPRRGRRAPRRR
jgi:hypothetical protein